MGNRVVAAGFGLMSVALLGGIVSCSANEDTVAAQHGIGDLGIAGGHQNGAELVFDAPLCASNYLHIQEPAQAPNGVNAKGDLVWHGPIRAVMFLHGCDKEPGETGSALPLGTVKIHGNVFATDLLHKAQR